MSLLFSLDFTVMGWCLLFVFLVVAVLNFYRCRETKVFAITTTGMFLVVSFLATKFIDLMFVNTHASQKFFDAYEQQTLENKNIGKDSDNIIKFFNDNIKIAIQKDT